MNQDRIAYYQSKITSESMTGIICTMYELFFEYLDEANLGDRVDPDSARRASNVLEHFKDTLDFTYEISGNLFAIYDFCERQISKAMYTNKPEHLEAIKPTMRNLQEAFIEVHKQDDSGSAMKNSQQVKAGVTYGRNDVTEMMDVDGNRGFLV